MSETSERIRREFRASDEKRDAGLTSPADVERFDDIVYGTLPKEQVLDVYRPKAMAGKKLPVIISVHGGGWVYGDKELYQYYCMNLAERGFAVVNFTYRLAPEHKYPASIEDTNLVFTWVLEHAAEYDLDEKHIFAVGDSAGAHNLGLYSLICTNPEYAARYPFQAPKGFVPTAIALNCGVYQIVDSEETPEETRLLMKDFLPGGGKPEEFEALSIAPFITEDFPPSFIMTATGDFLTGQPRFLTEKLIEKQVPFVSRFYGDAKHKLGHVFHCNMRSEAAKLCNDEECDFFRRFL